MASVKLIRGYDAEQFCGGAYLHDRCEVFEGLRFHSAT